MRLKNMHPDLKLSPNRVKTSVDKQGKSPLDYIPNVVEAFQRIKKGSNYYGRILVQQKPKGKTTYKGKMEKRFDAYLDHKKSNQPTR